MKCAYISAVPVVYKSGSYACVVIFISPPVPIRSVHIHTRTCVSASCEHIGEPFVFD